MVLRLMLLVATVVFAAMNAGKGSADSIDDYMAREMAARKIPGAAVAVLRGGKLIKRAAYGEASVEHHVPVTAETTFVLASMTKVFTATAVMTLVQDQRLALDQPVRAVLPEIPEAWSPITVRQCLSHTSGLPELADDLNVTPSVGDRATYLQTLAARVAQPPGERVAYNQLCYVLMAMIIERLSGASYETYLRDRVLKPAGAAGARFGDAWDILPGRAELYTAVDITPDHGKLLARDGRPVLADRIRRYGSKTFPDFMWPAAGLNASLDQLINFELALGSGRIISPALLAQMAKPPQLPDGRAGVFGLGFIVGQLDGHKTLAYGGGAATWRLSSPEQDLTVIVLTNLQGCYPDRLAADVIKLAAIIP